MMTFFGRKVISTKLDEVPALMRLAPGLLVITDKELAALGAGDAKTYRHLVELVMQDDLAALSKKYGGLQ